MTTPRDHRAVSATYDRIAATWHAARGQMPESLRAILDRALSALPREPSALDVGCGSGVPIARYLTERGCRVTGVDASEELLAIGRTVVPNATFIHGDMRTVTLAERFDLIVAWDSVFHIPRADHATVFARLASWLAPRGRLVLSLGGSAWEGTSEMFGETFFYSGFDIEESLQLLHDAGITVLESNIDDDSSRGHLAILAKPRPAAVIP